MTALSYSPRRDRVSRRQQRYELIRPLISLGRSHSAQAQSPSETARCKETIYCFGEFQFSPHRHLLLRRALPMKLGSRALDLLHLLIDHPGVVVSKSDLIRFAWPDTFVDESNLKVNISGLRAVLGETQEGLPHIATVPGRGYKFVAQVLREELKAVPAKPAPIEPRLDSFPAARTLHGREDELNALSYRLRSKGFVTITGHAGVGKSVLASELGRRLAGEFEGGACFVDLTTIYDARLIGAAIAASLGANGSVESFIPATVDLLGRGRRLIVLDGCEHLAQAIGAAIDRLRDALPDLLVLCTSRSSLGCLAESVYRLLPPHQPIHTALRV